MNKERLRSTLSTEYTADQWREVLREVFGARSLQQRSKSVSLPANNLADAALELGSFETSDDRLVGLYQVDLKKNVRIGQNRVGVRSLLRSVYKYDVDAALVVFVQNDKWRLSLISEIRVRDPQTDEIVEQKTEPKRFTYLLGVGETVRTTSERLLTLANQPYDLEKLIDAFSVEKLNKAFFKRYKELFGEFCEHLTVSGQYRELFLNSRTKPTEGWKDPLAKPIRDFAKILLGRLVFLQFLQKKGWMGVPAGETAWENGDARFLQTIFVRTKDKDHFHSGALRRLFFETLNRKRDGDLAASDLGDDLRVPYLNGGLFDTDISTGNTVDFPKQLFADLLDFFEQYNFTIDEDDPYDREVGIDPEMLGHIFENLLEENREKGAFYTPKEIVHYMCQESLIEYLATHLPDADRPAIEKLVRDNQVADSFTGIAKATEIDRLLRDVKICDPAIGSGAFPMGLLKEIFECRRLVYPYLKTNETFDPARIKQEIIQNNIYGVDIDNGAVEIARLRFWLALVVDEIEPAPLPNLDYKIMQGNSLLEQFEDISLVFDKTKLSPETYVERNLFGDAVNPQMSLMDVLRVQQELGKFDVTKLESEFFGTEDAQQKAHIREQLNRLERLVIEQAIQAKETAIRSEIAKISSDIKHKQAAVRSEQRDKIIPSSTYKKLYKLEEQLEGVEKSKERLQAIRPDNKPYFLWHLYFQDVFEKGGFDIVIGNPPYVRPHNLSPEFKKILWTIFQSFVGKSDLYCCFIENSIRLLKTGGQLYFITSNSYLRLDSFENIRDLLLRGTLRRLIDFEDNVFSNAMVKTAIIGFQNSPPPNVHPVLTVSTPADANFENFEFIDIQQSEFSNTYKHIFDLSLDATLDAVKVAIRANSVPLEEVVDISFGLKTGDDSKFVSFENRSAKHKRLLRGENVQRYSLQFVGEFVWYVPKRMREHRQTARPGTAERFERPKILVRDTGDGLICTFDSDNYYVKDVLILGSNACNEDFLKTLTSILNSRLMKFYYETSFPTLHVQRDELASLPIKPNIGKTAIPRLVDTILKLKQTNPKANTSALEREIDELIYKLYDLTDDEIAIIEGN